VRSQEKKRLAADEAANRALRAGALLTPNSSLLTAIRQSGEAAMRYESPVTSHESRPS